MKTSVLKRSNWGLLFVMFFCTINTATYATQTLSLYVRESQNVVCPSLPTGYTVYACNFASPSTAITTYSVGNHGGYIKVDSYFNGSVSVQCDQYYYYYIGNFRYAGHRTTYYIVTCKTINITLSDTYKEMAPNSYYNLSYTSNPYTSVYSPVVTWTSSNLSVAQVSSTGRIHAIAPGTATITAHNSSGPDKTCTVVVQNPSPTSITVTPGTVSMPRGQSRTLSHSVTPSNSSYTLNWISSNTSVATVNNGIVYGVAPGSANITACINGTNISDYCHVTVQPINPTAISIEHNKSVNVGQNKTISSAVIPSNADYNIIWTSSNPSVATVNNGLVYGINNGTTRIMAQIAGTLIYDTCLVEVIRPTLTLQASSPSGWVVPGTTIMLSTSDNSTSIRYTTDGSTPNQNSTLYTSPIPVNDSLTIKAIAYHANYYPSDMFVGIYKVNNFQLTEQYPLNYTNTSLPTIPSVTFNKAFIEGANYSNVKLYTGSSVPFVSSYGDEVDGEKIIVGNTLYFIPLLAGYDTARAYCLHVPEGALESDCHEPNLEYSVWYTEIPHGSVQPLQDLSFANSEDSLTLFVGNNYILHPSIYPTNGAFDTLFWHVTDSSVVRVSHYGVIEALAVGSCLVSLTAIANGITYSATTHVSVIDEFEVSTAVNGGVGDVSGDGTFCYLSQVTITASPAPCYHFVQWNDGNTDNPRVFLLTQDTVFSATFVHDDPVEEHESIISCDSYAWKNNVYSQSGTYIFDTLTIQGCDSSVVLTLTINQSDFGIESVTSCNGYEWNGVFYTESTTTPTFSSTNINGCDSVINLHLTINHCSTTEVSACDSYVWHNFTYTTSGEYIDGNDTIILTINHPSVYIETIEACDSITWHGTQYTYSTTGPSYLISGGNMYGCDSIVHLNLTIHRSTTRNICVTTNSSSYLWNDSTYTQSGTYTWVGSTEFGCDSIVTLLLSLYDSDNVEIKDIEEDISSVIIYPSPTKGMATIKAPFKIKELTIYNISGVAVQNLSNTDTIDLTGMHAGMYLVSITSENETTIIKIIKE